jgi:hypothetical protein
MLFEKGRFEELPSNQEICVPNEPVIGSPNERLSM